MLSTITEIQELSHRMFFNSLNCHGNKLLDKIELPPSDLGPTSSLSQTLQLLKDILACHDASVVDYDNKKQDFKQVQYIYLLASIIVLAVFSHSYISD